MENNDPVWYPYAQMKLPQDRLKVVKAEQEFLHLEDGKVLVDGVSSWWAAIHGYNHPALNQALIAQLQQFSHVMLGGLTHEPVQAFARKLVEITPEGLDHVFFSDSGSVGVEVALKIAVQYWANQNRKSKHRFVALRRAYHGDTFKAMEVGDDSDYQNAYSHALQKGFYLNIPEGGFNAGEDQVNAAIQELEALLEKHHGDMAAFIVEPIMQGAGGFQVYSPAYLKAASELCRKFEVLLIADEVATGFGRTGKWFACEHAEITPDIMILGKALTGGYLGHAATLVTHNIYEAFLGDHYEHAFMHGPTFMGNPLACAVGLKSIEIFETENYLAKIGAIEQSFRVAFESLSHPKIKAIRILGAMIVIELDSAESAMGFKSHAMKQGLWLRPIGQFLYATPPYRISQASLLRIIEGLKSWFY